MATIPLTRGHVAIVDDDDFEYLNQWYWHSTGKYARRRDGKRFLFMHRAFLPDDNPFQVDHINGNGFDNRRENLRLVTASENRANSRRRSDGSSQFKGVSLRRTTGRWEAKILTPTGRRHLGFFADEETAARAYDAAAREVFGRFAHLNFP